MTGDDDLASAGPRRRRRRRRRPNTWAASIAFASLSLPTAAAGLLQLAWEHPPTEFTRAMATDASGNILVGGCAGEPARAVVRKFDPRGALLWRREPTWTADPATECVTSLAADEATGDIFVAARTSHPVDGDLDIGLARLGPDGRVIWQRTMGSPWADVPTALGVAGARPMVLVLGGYSAGNVAEGRASRSNCPDPDACVDGFVLGLDPAVGDVLWAWALASPDVTAADRVAALALDVDAESVVIVGDTRGAPWPLTDDRNDQEGSQDNSPRGGSTWPPTHAGDVVVAKVDARSGQTRWRRRLGDADPLVAELCSRPQDQLEDPGTTIGCAVAVHAADGGVTVAATTTGFLAAATSPPNDDPQYARLCGRRRPPTAPPCRQLVVARLDGADGSVRWLHQLVGAPRAAPTALLALEDIPHGDRGAVVVSGRVEPGWLSSESMEQLLLVRLSGEGVIAWAREDGLPGPDDGGWLASRQQPGVDRPATDGTFLVLSTGTRQRARVGIRQETAIHRHRADTGAVAPLCVDGVVLVGGQRATGGGAAPQQQQLELQLRRSPPLCPGAAPAPVTYTVTTTDADGRELGRVHGVVQLASSADPVTITVDLPPPEAISAHVSIAANDATAVEAIGPTTIPITLVDASSDPLGVSAAAAADGHFWRELTWLALVLVGAALGAILTVGPCCWRRCMRRARVFQYKMIRLPKRKSDLHDLDDAQDLVSGDPLAIGHAAPVAMGPTGIPARETPTAAAGGGTSAPSTVTPFPRSRPQQRRPTPPEADDDVDELRSHLEEIQALNTSLEGLLLNEDPGARGSLEPTPPSPGRHPPSPRRARRSKDHLRVLLTATLRRASGNSRAAGRKH